MALSNVTQAKSHDRVVNLDQESNCQRFFIAKGGQSQTQWVQGMR